MTTSNRGHDGGSDPLVLDEPMDLGFPPDDEKVARELEMRRAAQTVVCSKCGHLELYHGENGCDVEVRDYGDMDCGCRG